MVIKLRAGRPGLDSRESIFPSESRPGPVLAQPPTQRVSSLLP
jgi:hypothetical protein